MMIPHCKTCHFINNKEIQTQHVYFAVAEPILNGYLMLFLVNKKNGPLNKFLDPILTFGIGSSR